MLLSCSRRDGLARLRYQGILLRQWQLAIVCALSLCAAGCATVQTTAPGAVGIDRKQRMFVSEKEVELAAVIGHEISHALREHTRERVSRAYAQQLALAGLAVFTGAGDAAMGVANQVASVTFQLPHSREQESEADVMGLELMARAGYD